MISVVRELDYTRVERAQENGRRAQIASNTPAAPMPVPTHIVTMP